MLRNRWPDYTGLGGRNRPESPADLDRKTHIWWECEYLMENCPWYKVYDFVESMYGTLHKSSDPVRASVWEKLINECFIEQGVGWRMVEGQLESRGPEGFKVAVDTARQSLEEAKLPTAHGEIHEAMKDLSRRPEPYLTGAIPTI